MSSKINLRPDEQIRMCVRRGNTDYSQRKEGGGGSRVRLGCGSQWHMSRSEKPHQRFGLKVELGGPRRWSPGHRVLRGYVEEEAAYRVKTCCFFLPTHQHMSSRHRLQPLTWARRRAAVVLRLFLGGFSLNYHNRRRLHLCTQSRPAGPLQTYWERSRAAFSRKSGRGVK